MTLPNQFQLVRRQRDEAVALLESFRRMVVSSDNEDFSSDGSFSQSDLDHATVAIQAEQSRKEELIRREIADRLIKREMAERVTRGEDDRLPSGAITYLVELGQYWLKDRKRDTTTFDEEFYLDSNPDIREAVSHRRFVTGFHHWLTYGAVEGRLYRFKETLPLAEMCAKNNSVFIKSSFLSKVINRFGFSSKDRI